MDLPHEPGDHGQSAWTSQTSRSPDSPDSDIINVDDSATGSNQHQQPNVSEGHPAGSNDQPHILNNQPTISNGPPISDGQGTVSSSLSSPASDAQSSILQSPSQHTPTITPSTVLHRTPNGQIIQSNGLPNGHLNRASELAGGNSNANGSNDDDTMDILRIGYQFKVFDLPEDTWAGIWKEVKDALSARGTNAVNIRSIHKVDPNDNKSRWKRQQLVCKCSGPTRVLKKIDDPDRQRNKVSNKTNCPLKVTVSWPKTGPPNITQLELNHNEACTAQHKKPGYNTHISNEELQSECYEDIKQWTMAGLRKSDMFRLLQSRFAPRKLDEDGRRKVRNICLKVDRELAEITEHFTSNWEAGEGAVAVESAMNDEHTNIANDDILMTPIREKLLANLKGIAGREASRLCLNLSSRLTPEMAMAVYQNLSLQVDALISGSGVVAGPMRVGPGLAMPNVPPPASSHPSQAASPAGTPHGLPQASSQGNSRIPIPGGSLLRPSGASRMPHAGLHFLPPAVSHLPPAELMPRVPPPGTQRSAPSGSGAQRAPPRPAASAPPDIGGEGGEAAVKRARLASDA